MWPDAQQTEELLAGARAGDAGAVNDLLEQHRDAVRRMIDLRMDQVLKRRVDASDIVQEVLIDANRRLRDYLANPVMPFHLWLRQMAKDRLIDAHRRHRQTARRSMDREQPLAVAGGGPVVDQPRRAASRSAAHARGRGRLGRAAAPVRSGVRAARRAGPRDRAHAALRASGQQRGGRSLGPVAHKRPACATCGHAAAAAAARRAMSARRNRSVCLVECRYVRSSRNSMTDQHDLLNSNWPPCWSESTDAPPHERPTLEELVAAHPHLAADLAPGVGRHDGGRRRGRASQPAWPHAHASRRAAAGGQRRRSAGRSSATSSCWRRSAAAAWASCSGRGSEASTASSP